MSNEFPAVLAAYLSKNTVAVNEIPEVAKHIRIALGEVVADEAPAEPTFPGREARVLTAREIRDAVTPADILCFEDNKRYKTLRRTLTKFGLTPEQYLQKWGLPSDFPMVSEDYSLRRRDIAVSQGLGKTDATA